jgi:hypothetical protein
VGALSC